MRTLILSLALAVLAACASKPHQRLKVDATSSLFQGESLWRLSGQGEGLWLKDCYQGELKRFTDKARVAYQDGAKSARYWSWVGNCLVWHNELREARFFLGMALQLAQDKEEKAMVQNNLAVVYLRMGRVSRAYELLTEAKALAPHFVTPTFNLAQLYVAQNMNLEALKLLAQTPFKESPDPEVLHLRGLAHLQNGQSAEAAPHLSRIPPDFHSREDFALTLAQWHLKERRPERAQEVLRRYESTGLAQTAKLGERLKREVAREIAALKEANK